MAETMKELIRKIENDEKLKQEEWKVFFEDVGRENKSITFNEISWENVTQFYKNFKIDIPELIEIYFKETKKKIKIMEFELFDIKELEKIFHDFVINLHWKNSLFPIGQDDEENIVMIDLANKSKLKISGCIMDYQ